MVNIRIEDLEGDLSEGISDDDADIGNNVVSGDGTATNDDVFSSGEDYAFSPISGSDLDVESEGFSATESCEPLKYSQDTVVSPPLFSAAMATTPEPSNVQTPMDIFLSDPINEWKGFKIIGDNIDKNIHRSYQRIGRTTQSLHYFHACAVLDRVDFSGLSDEPPQPSIVDPLEFLPSQSDITLVKQDFAILISRFLYVPFFYGTNFYCFFIFMQNISSAHR